jgi:DNA polymerase-1
VASQIFGIPQELVTSQMRRTAKAVNFGIIYGISEYGLAQSAHLTAGNARKYIENYFMSYPSIKTYLDGCVENARRDGFVTTVTGRRRMLPEINSKNFRLRSFAERAAMNMPLQGSAADIIKIAMIGVDGEIRKRGLKSRLILQIHDELIVDAFEEELEEVKDILKNTMENAVRLSVPLTVNVSCGRDMNEAK